MAKGNTVEVKFAGEASGFNRVVKQVADNSEESAGRMKRAFDKTGDAADASESKFMGMADVLDGLGGAFGIPTEGATNMMRSFGDLSGGFAVLQPVVGKVSGSFKSFGATLLANPIVLIAAGIIALGAALIYAYHHSETFRNIVDGAFRAVAGAAVFMKDLVVGVFRFVVDTWLGMAEMIVKGAATAFGWVPGIGDDLRAAAAAVEGFRDDVNRALGGITDKTIAVNLRVNEDFRAGERNFANGARTVGTTVPRFHDGGVFRAPTSGGEGLAILQDGETVLRPGGGGGTVNHYTITVQSGQVLSTSRDIEDAVANALQQRFNRGGALTDGRGGTLRPA